MYVHIYARVHTHTYKILTPSRKAVRVPQNRRVPRAHCLPGTAGRWKKRWCTLLENLLQKGMLLQCPHQWSYSAEKGSQEFYGDDNQLRKDTKGYTL